MMDTESYDALHQTRGEPWDRGLHAQLLNKLADDGCALVVMDCFFGKPRDAQKDAALAQAMRRQRHIVLMAEQALAVRPELDAVRPVLPAEPFYSATSQQWGVAWLDPDSDGIVRRHWPFPSPGPYPSLAETAASLSRSQKVDAPRERWLRYYGPEPPWKHISYTAALQQPRGHFRDEIVFIGVQPKTSVFDNEPDKFRTPYSRWTGQAEAGTEIIITSFLNLLNGQSLFRSAALDLLVIVFIGFVMGAVAGFGSKLKSSAAVVSLTALAMILSSVLTSYTNYWYPWLIIVGGQMPVALLWGLVTGMSPVEAEAAPKIPGYSLVFPPFGRGAYGRVWLAQGKNKVWRAVKVVRLSDFENDVTPFEREFAGVTLYHTICRKHPSLLQVEFLSERFPTYFYYIMELGDSIASGWEKEPARYRPRDLNAELTRAPGKRLPISQCVSIGMAVSTTLELLHQQGVTHRDIKPQNILYVNGHPKLADLGLITDIRASAQRTLVGTPGYMPPAPETPGTPQADIYALGMVLYVISTGRRPALFPEISATLLGGTDEFLLLNNIILKACEPNPIDRFNSARQMFCELEKLQKAVVSSQ